MAVDHTGRIGWFSPDPRAIIPLDEQFHIPHGLKRALKKKAFTITVNRAFPAVIRECSIRNESTWISPGIIRAYTQLHRLGHAHSVEVWNTEPTPNPSKEGRGNLRLPSSGGVGGGLAGGLYGVAIGGAFFGESMFHRVTDASKVALVFLVERLRERGFALLDTQWVTPHLAKFGAHEIPREEYLRRLAAATSMDCHFD